MQRISGWIIGAGIAVALGTGLSLAVLRVKPLLLAPQMFLSDERVEFGQSSAGQEETAYVTLENRGRSTLNVLGVHVSCGCTKVVVEKNKVAPGSATRLRITASGTRLGVPQHNTVTIATNDVRRPVVQIDLYVHPTKSFGFSPGEIDFGRIESHRLPATEMVMLKLDGGLPVKQDGAVIESDLPYSSCEIVGWDVAGNSLTAFVTLDSSAPAGEIVGRVTLRLPGSDREHSARISGCVVGDYFAEPPAIVWGPIRREDAPSTQAIRVRPRDNVQPTFKIAATNRGPEWPAEGLAISVVEGAANPELLLTLDPAKWSAPWSTHRLRTAVRISILDGDGKASELNVPMEIVLED